MSEDKWTHPDVKSKVVDTKWTPGGVLGRRFYVEGVRYADQSDWYGMTDYWKDFQKYGTALYWENKIQPGAVPFLVDPEEDPLQGHAGSNWALNDGYDRGAEVLRMEDQAAKQAGTRTPWGRSRQESNIRAAERNTDWFVRGIPPFLKRLSF